MIEEMICTTSESIFRLINSDLVNNQEFQNEIESLI